MAISQLIVSLGVFVLLSLVQGQLTITDTLPGCSRIDGQYGKYLKAHPYYSELYMQCDISQTRTVRQCPKPLLFDETLQICNWPNTLVLKNWPCSESLISRKYPSTCNDEFYECNGYGYDAKKCPGGQYFNSPSGTCTPTPVADHALCGRLGTGPGTPRVNCSLVAEPTDMCSFRTNVFGVLSSPVKCAEGTEFIEANCTCQTSQRCFRPNSSRNKVSDPDCRASFKLDFTRIVNNVPQVVTEKLGTGDVASNDSCLYNGVEVTTGLATLFTNAQTNVQPSIYCYPFANNQLGMNIVVSIVLRATQASSFEILSNNYENACTPTLEIKGQYNGGQFSVSLVVLGANADSGPGNGTTTATLSNSISASTGDYVEVKFLYDGHATVQLQNKGQNGESGGQVVAGSSTGYLGARLAYNACGFRFGQGLNGNIKKIVVRESCGDLNKGKNL